MIDTPLYAAAKVSHLLCASKDLSTTKREQIWTSEFTPSAILDHDWARVFHLTSGRDVHQCYYISNLFNFSKLSKCFKNTAELTAWDAVLDLCCIIKLHNFLRKLQQAQESQAEPSSLKETAQQQSNGGAELGSKVLSKEVYTLLNCFVWRE